MFIFKNININIILTEQRQELLREKCCLLKQLKRYYFDDLAMAWSCWKNEKNSSMHQILYLKMLFKNKKLINMNKSNLSAICTFNVDRFWKLSSGIGPWLVLLVMIASEQLTIKLTNWH